MSGGHVATDSCTAYGGDVNSSNFHTPDQAVLDPIDISDHLIRDQAPLARPVIAHAAMAGDPAAFHSIRRVGSSSLSGRHRPCCATKPVNRRNIGLDTMKAPEIFS